MIGSENEVVFDVPTNMKKIHLELLYKNSGS